jgi:hypothetical protein
VAAALAGQAAAATADIQFNGPGVSGTLVLTYGASTDAKYPSAYEVTGINGTFSDSNNGLNIVNAPIGPLEPIKHDIPEPTNLLAPNDFTRFAVATGLSPQNNGFLTYDNLFWPGGSPQTASDYPVHGGFLDIYGLMFDIGGGKVVDFWSNGISGPGADYYGVAVATSAKAFDYAGGVTASIVPEPSTWAMLLLGFAALGLGYAYRRRRSTVAAAL